MGSRGGSGKTKEERDERRQQLRAARIERIESGRTTPQMRWNQGRLMCPHPNCNDYHLTLQEATEFTDALEVPFVCRNGHSAKLEIEQLHGAVYVRWMKFELISV